MFIRCFEKTEDISMNNMSISFYLDHIKDFDFFDFNFKFMLKKKFQAMQTFSLAFSEIKTIFVCFIW